MNYKVVFHKITWSKFMLIFPLFFLFWRWDENNLLRFWHLYIRCDLRDVRCYASATTQRLSRLYKCFGVLYYSLTSSRCKDSYLPQRIDTKNAKWRAAAMNFYFDVIRWFTNYTNFNESFSRLFKAFYLVVFLFLTEEAWSHGGLRSREFGQTPSHVSMGD